MVRNWKILALAAVIGGTVGVPQIAFAQGHSQDHKADQKDKDKDKDKDKNKDDKNGSPSFCRSGAGHPRFGRQWCVEKGFGLGSTRWGNAGWGNVVFGRNTSRQGTVSNRTLSDILGRVIYGRLVNQSNQLGGGTLTGRWLTPSDGPMVLQVQSGTRPVAEFVDRNRDGRTDVILLNLSR